MNALISSNITRHRPKLGNITDRTQKSKSQEAFFVSDSVHGNIGVKWKEQEEILTINDLVNVIESSGNNYVLQVIPSDFVQFSNICRKRKKNPIPFMENLQMIQFRKGSGSIFYKEKFDAAEPFVECKLVPIGNLLEFPKS